LQSFLKQAEVTGNISFSFILFLISFDLGCFEIEWEKKETVSVGDIFDHQPMLNIRFGAGTGYASGCFCGSTKMIRLLTAPSPQHAYTVRFLIFNFVRAMSLNLG
jgi:hypothetical protein